MQPYEKAVATGDAYKNKKRYEDSGNPTVQKLGDPSDGMTEAEQAIWYAFKREIPWLYESHRALMEIACATRARVRQGSATMQEIKMSVQILKMLGASPTSENQIPDGYKTKEIGYDPADDDFG